MASPIRTVLRVASGNFLEMYDFMIFGYYATFIAHAFFPSSSEYASLMLTLATFGAGFLMRPIGAIILGIYIDAHGRRKGLLLTLGLMSIGTLAVACMPGYAHIGLFAPIFILIARLVQGFSAGVELGGVSVYLSEIATPGKKGFYVAWQSASQQIAVVFAATLGVILHSVMPEAELEAWGWRIPLLIGCLIIPFLFRIRKSLTETEVFLARKHRPSVRELYQSILQHKKIVVAGALLSTMSTVTFYMITAYTPTFGSSVLHLAPIDNFTVTMCVGISNFCWLLGVATLSDRIGRRPILLACTVLSLCTAYPALSWLAASPTFLKLLGVELWLSFLYAGYNAAAIVYLTEIMPEAVRTTGFSLAYSLATALFGGFTPAICTYLIHETNDHAAPGFWLMFAALCGIAAIFATRNRGRNFENPSII
jgi:MFS family permease